MGEQGDLRRSERIQLPNPWRALEKTAQSRTIVLKTAMISDTALAKDWDRPGEDKSWSHLHQAQ